MLEESTSDDDVKLDDDSLEMLAEDALEEVLLLRESQGKFVQEETSTIDIAMKSNDNIDIFLFFIFIFVFQDSTL